MHQKICSVSHDRQLAVASDRLHRLTPQNKYKNFDIELFMIFR